MFSRDSTSAMYIILQTYILRYDKILYIFTSVLFTMQNCSIVTLHVMLCKKVTLTEMWYSHLGRCRSSVEVALLSGHFEFRQVVHSRDLPLLFVRAGTTPLGFALLFPVLNVHSLIIDWNTRTCWNFCQVLWFHLVVRSNYLRLTTWFTPIRESKKTVINLLITTKEDSQIKRTKDNPGRFGVRQERNR